MPIVANQEEEEQQGMTTGQQSQNQQLRQPAPGEEVSVGGSQPSAIGATAATTPKKGVGSGLVTDTKKYIEANKPASTAMAGAVVKGVQKQASNIGAGVAKQQKAFQSQLSDSKARMAAAKQFGQQQIAQAGQGLKKENIGRFRNIVTGREGFNQAKYNAQAQKAQAEKLQEKAKRSEREDVRGQLLRETFGKNRKYTGGQRTLDQLLLAGSPEARRSMVSQVRQAAQQAQTGTQEARKAALRQMGEQSRAGQAMREQLSQGVLGAEGTIRSDVEQKIADDLVSRQALVDKAKQQLGAYDASGGLESYRAQQEAAGQAGAKLSAVRNEIAQSSKELEDLNRSMASGDYANITPREEQRAKYLRSRIDSLQGQIGGLEKAAIASRGSIGYDASDLTLDRDVAEALGLKEGQDVYDVDLASKLGVGREKTREEAASQAEFARMKALAALRGGEQEYFKPDSRDIGKELDLATAYSGRQAIQDAIAKRAADYAAIRKSEDQQIAEKRNLIAGNERYAGFRQAMKDDLENLERRKRGGLAQEYGYGKKLRYSNE